MTETHFIKLRHVIKDYPNLRSENSEIVRESGLEWCLIVKNTSLKKPEGAIGDLSVHVSCSQDPSRYGEFEVHTNVTVEIPSYSNSNNGMQPNSNNGISPRKQKDVLFQGSSETTARCYSTDHAPLLCNANNEVVIECGIMISYAIRKPPKRKMMNFDEVDRTAKDNITLVVAERKFNVSKEMLMEFSRHFQKLFSKNPNKKVKEYILGGDLDPDGFDSMLEVFHGNLGVLANYSIEEVLKAAKYCESQMVINRCENYFLNQNRTSRTSINEQFQFRLADKYDLETLLKELLDKPTTIYELMDMVPQNYVDIKASTCQLFFQKLMAKHST